MSPKPHINTAMKKGPNFLIGDVCFSPLFPGLGQNILSKKTKYTFAFFGGNYEGHFILIFRPFPALKLGKNI